MLWEGHSGIVDGEGLAPPFYLYAVNRFPRGLNDSNLCLPSPHDLQLWLSVPTQAVIFFFPSHTRASPPGRYELPSVITRKLWMHTHVAVVSIYRGVRRSVLLTSSSPSWKGGRGGPTRRLRFRDPVNQPTESSGKANCNQPPYMKRLRPEPPHCFWRRERQDNLCTNNIGSGIVRSTNTKHCEPYQTLPKSIPRSV